mgnify:CR=1 FL=1
MTCGEHVVCSLCAPPLVQRRDEKGHYAVGVRYAWSAKGKTGAVVMVGNLQEEVRRPGTTSRTPHIHLCTGCAERALGRKLRPGEVEMQEEDD